MKVCKYCGTTDNLIIDKNTQTIWNLCYDCRSTRIRERNKRLLTGKKRSKETCDLISKSRIGKKLTSDHKHNISVACVGRTRSIESRKKQSNSISGKNHPNYGKSLSDKICIKSSITQIYKTQHYKEKYPLFCLEEQIRDAPYEKGKAGIQVHCKKCNDWFTPTYQIIANRISAIYSNKSNYYFYCSSACKNSCSLFNFNTAYFLNNLNHQPIESIHNSPEYQTFRKEVLSRQLISEGIQNNHCEMCNSELNLRIHHEHPQKTHPHLSLDPDNGIILCSTCHYKIGHTGDCSTGSLANKICT